MIRSWTFAMVMLISVIVNGQSYVPMTTPGTRWLNHVISQFGVHYLQALDIGSDTLIGGSLYSRVEGFFPGAMRDDGGQVWFYPEDTTEFSSLNVDSFPILLYDFALAVGDSFPMPLDPTTWTHVIARDSIMLLDGTYRDRIEFASNPGTIWIEGIGDPLFVFNSMWTTWEVLVWLECYGIDLTPLHGYCLYLGTEQISADQLAFTLQQSMEDGLVRLDGSWQDIREVQILSASGQHIRTFAGPRSSVDLSSLPAGRYLLAIRTERSSQVLRALLSERY